MKVFLSSTFLDLIDERRSVLDALHKKHASTLAMEYFLATPSTPRDTALEQLRNSDVMILVIGFKAGTLIPDDSGSTYTSAEYDELLRLGKEPLVFVKQKKVGRQKLPLWRNEETVPEKSKALNDFKARLEKWTPAYFATPDGLALAVILALEAWVARGRPGARKTFSSTTEYFASKNPAGHFPLLDFSTTLLGREDQIRALDDFGDDKQKRVCILSGRGGIGKSKILYDWAHSNSEKVVFLKDEPLWYEDSDKEIPVVCTTVIVDDAHRQERFGKILQLLQDTAGHKQLKLIVSTRPGGTAGILPHIVRNIDPNQLLQLPELQELDKKQSKALAEQVLGNEFSGYAAHLAEIGSNSPLVIVAGGRLIATRRINPSTLTTLPEFRTTIFNRLLHAMDLRGPKFIIDPPLPILELVAALGPVNVEHHEFQKSAEAFLGKRVDEILATIDALASNGIITARPKPVRVIPDVLSDYILEERCIGTGNRSTRYADHVYERFGAHSLKSLMRNLAELDWRRGQLADSRLNLLNEIWVDIYECFRTGDEYTRHQIIVDLAGAAIYQPENVIRLIRMAIDNPIQVDNSGEGSRYRAGQHYVLSALPSLLEATSYHPLQLRESVTILWELAKSESTRSNNASSAQAVLKRLASWQRFVNPAFNFAILLEAIRLIRRPDAFTSDFTPFALIQQILEREGEFNEWQDEMTMSFGGFGLNYAGVGPVRENAIDFLEFALQDDGNLAIHTVSILGDMLGNHLNRVGRQSTQDEKAWQDRERMRCFQSLLHRFDQPASPILKARIYDSIRSATAIHHPDFIRQAASSALEKIVLDDPSAVIDAICTAEYDLPLISADYDETMDRPSKELMSRSRSSLERLIASPGNQARFTIDQTHACIEVRIKTNGFHRFMFAFADRPDFLAEMADQLIAHPRIDEMISQLSSVLGAIHGADPAAFRKRALSALESGAIQVIHASANNLRVFEGATEQDIAVIQAYGEYPDPVAKRGAIFAIAYMGKFTELRLDLKNAALSIHTEGNPVIAADLVDAFGPYGIPLTMLTRVEAAAVASEFLTIDDWSVDQDAIPRFLNRFVTLFPDETYDLLLRRSERSAEAKANHLPAFRTFGHVRENISFGGVASEKKLQLASHCISRLIKVDSAEELADMFWHVAGYEGSALQLILGVASDADEKCASHIATLIGKSIPRLAFTNTAFAKDLLRRFTGERRKRIVEAFARQARRLGGGGAFAGSFEDHMDQQQKEFAAQVAALPNDPELEDLARALRHLT